MPAFLPDFKDPVTWVDLVLSLLIIGVSLFLLLRILKRKFAIAYMVVGYVLLLISWLFKLELFRHVIILALAVGLVAFLVANVGAFRTYVTNSLASKAPLGLTRRQDVEKVYDRQALCRRVNEAVISLSKQKIGAIITFERRTKLDDMIKTGTLVHAPLSAELLMTIFFPGTRLHDGAVIVRRDEILAASVYYTPTTKPLAGKYGSRHRAAIGISEISDAVTVVVSEETGRISLAIAGELIPVSLDNFLRVFTDSIFQEEKEAAPGPRGA